MGLTQRRKTSRTDLIIYALAIVSFALMVVVLFSSRLLNDPAADVAFTYPVSNDAQPMPTIDESVTVALPAETYSQPEVTLQSASYGSEELEAPEPESAAPVPAAQETAPEPSAPTVAEIVTEAPAPKPNIPVPDVENTNAESGAEDNRPENPYRGLTEPSVTEDPYSWFIENDPEYEPVHRREPGFSEDAPSQTSSVSTESNRVSQAKRLLKGQTNGDIYTVGRGDVLWRIALAHQVEVDDMVTWNNLRNPDLILVGQTLRVQPH